MSTVLQCRQSYNEIADRDLSCRTDIDHMYERYIMTTDPDRFPLPRVRDLVDYLHEHDQHYIVMVRSARLSMAQAG